MKRKVGTVLETDLLRRAKRKAADEERPLSDLIQDALDRYLTAGMPDPGLRDAAYNLFCEQPIRIAPEQFSELLKTGVWDS